MRKRKELEGRMEKKENQENEKKQGVEGGNGIERKEE